MNGTVAPSSNNATAACTCTGLTASSAAMRESMEIGMGNLALSNSKAAHYAERRAAQQVLLRTLFKAKARTDDRFDSKNNELRRLREEHSIATPATTNGYLMDK